MPGTVLCSLHELSHLILIKVRHLDIGTSTLQIKTVKHSNRAMILMYQCVSGISGSHISDDVLETSNTAFLKDGLLITTTLLYSHYILKYICIDC